MLSSSPGGWPLEDSTSHEQTMVGPWRIPQAVGPWRIPQAMNKGWLALGGRNYMDRYAYTCYSPPLLHFPFLSPSTTSPQAELAPDPPGTPFGAANGESTMVRKLNHNTSERDRQKKMNGAYSTLSPLLPAADQMKNLSIPTMVSRARKYISELQQQVEKLTREKEKLLSRMYATRDGDYRANHQEMSEGKGSLLNLVPSISTARLSDSEVAIQIFTRKVMAHQTVDFSEVLLTLDCHGFPLISSSTFESCGGTRTTFYNLHVQVERSWGMECEALKEKLSALFDHRNRSDEDFLRQLGNQII